jgi:hypothetical protein
MPVYEKSKSLPAGVYAATLAGVQEDDSQHGKVLKWDWRTDDGGIVGLTSTKLNEKSKFGQIVAALVGSIPDNLNTDALLGRSCTIVVKQDGDFTKVTDWLPTGQKPDPFTSQ